MDPEKNHIYRNSGCPYYDDEAACWKVSFPDREAEEGSLLYVVSEFIRGGLYFPFNDSQTSGKPYPGHAHSFDGVLKALLDDPNGFSIEGFEDHYSEQEQTLLEDLRHKLIKQLANQP